MIPLPTAKHRHFTGFPSESRHFFASDIHDNIHLVKRCLNELGFRWPKGEETHDYLWLAGDIIDRGPDVMKSIETCIHNPAIEFVLGNHEMNAIAATVYNKAYNRAEWPIYGGKHYLSYDPYHLKHTFGLASQHPIAITLEIGNKIIGLSHAGVPGGDWDAFVKAIDAQTLDRQDHLYALETRVDHSNPKQISNVDATIHGHTYTALENVYRTGNQLFIDGGMDDGHHCRLLEFEPDGELLGLFDLYEFSQDHNGHITWLHGS